jgi:hypothetical protein
LSETLEFDKKLYKSKGDKGLATRHEILGVIDSYRTLGQMHSFIFKNEKEYKKLVDKVSSNIKTKLKLILKKYNKNLGNYLTGKEINELNTVRKRIGV